MRYHNITKDDMLNGEGLRTVLWVAGCSHNCPGCHNPVTWDVRGGLPFDEAAKEELFAELEKDYISGVTFSGGDPLHPANREDIARLAEEIRGRYPNKTIWLYTGYDWEQIDHFPVKTDFSKPHTVNLTGHKKLSHHQRRADRLRNNGGNRRSLYSHSKPADK